MTTFTVGTDQTYKTLTAAVAAAKPGDTINVKAGTYTNDFPGQINSLTIQGVGGVATFVATQQPGNGKAIFDVAGTTKLINLDISGVTVPDTNGAAIRYESGDLTITNVSIHGNQDGILGGADSNGTITIDRSEIYGNGTNAGNTHNLYIGAIKTFTLTNSYIHDANVGHEIKSRAANNVITGNRILDNNSTASYQIDLPWGGNARIENNVIQKSPNSGNHVTIAYAEEGPQNSGTSVQINNNTFISDQSGANVIWDTSGVAVTASNNSIYNFQSVDRAGYVSASGFTTTGSRASLDTSSTIDRSGNGSSNSGNSGNSSNTGTTTPVPAGDSTAPTITVSQSVTGNTSSTSNTLSGTVSDSGSGVAAVEILVNSNGRTTDIGPASLNGGNWTYNVANLAPGTYTFYAVGYDRAGNATPAIQIGASETVTAATTQPTQPTPSPLAISGVTVNRNAVLMFGKGAANSVVTLTDTSPAGKATTIGQTNASSDGSWGITSQTVSPQSVHALTVTQNGQTASPIFLASTGSDTLTGTAGRTDLFLFGAATGNDMVRGFEPASAGSTHDVIELVGTSYQNFDQLKPQISGTGAAVIRLDGSNSITLSGVSASSLSPADFRFA